MSAQRESKPQAHDRYCPRCGAGTGVGDRYCRACESPLDGDVGRSSSSGPAGLQAVGVALIALAGLFAIYWYVIRPEQGRPALERIPIGNVRTGGPSTDRPLTPREAADGLFVQAMTAYESGDSAAAVRLIPMALSVYRGLDSLDLDARYHIATLSLAGSRPQDAIAQADTTLAQAPDHLLALAVAALAYERLGKPGRAAELYRRFLAAYSPQTAASRPEYIDHRTLLPVLRQTAEQFLEANGGDPS